MSVLDFTASGSLDAYDYSQSPSGGISAIVLYTKCATVTDPSDNTELAALVAAGDATILCVKNAEKPVGSDVTIPITTACGTKNVIKSRDNTLTFDALLNCTNVDFFDTMNGCSEFQVGYLTCTAGENPVFKFYDITSDATLSVDDEFTGTNDDGEPLLKGTITFKTYPKKLLGDLSCGLSQAFLDLFCPVTTGC